MSHASLIIKKHKTFHLFISPMASLKEILCTVQSSKNAHFEVIFPVYCFYLGFNYQINDDD